MNKSRRSFIRTITVFTGAVCAWLYGLFKPVFAFTQRNAGAFTAESAVDAIAGLFPDKQIIPSDAVHIDVHDLVENGAVVPIKIMSDHADIESISILVENNPNPLIAKFNLGPECSGFIATRIKVAQPSNIIAIVESGGKLYSQRKFVEVIEGGCG
jgi:sulfur-oxidizing protein SoxY